MVIRRQDLVGWLGIACVLLTPNCSTILGIDGEYGHATEGTGAGSSNGGSGGMGTTSSSGTGAGGIGGNGCPTGVGPDMVPVDDYCIDTTEVTREQYDAWLQTNPSINEQPDQCSWNSSFFPTNPSNGDEPVVGVDWCDAYAFCEGTGKHLCGGFDWQGACSANSGMQYPYGDIYDPTACNAVDYDGLGTQGTEHALPVKTASNCHGQSAPFDAIYDMSGNIDEWTTFCDDNLGPLDQCRSRGGDYGDAATAATCSSTRDRPRNEADTNIGFRCCGDRQ